jgi:hypothetical protein
MATFVNDTFTDTDSTNLDSHTGETGATWTRHGSSAAGSFLILGNRTTSNGGSNKIAYSSGTGATAEYDVTGVFSWASTTKTCDSITGRHDTAADTFYMLRISAAGDLELHKRIASTFTLLSTWATGVTPAASDIHTLKLEIRDAAKKGYYDGTVQVTTSDNAITAINKVGVRGNGASDTVGGRLDTLTAVDAVAVSGGVISPWVMSNKLTGPQALRNSYKLQINSWPTAAPVANASVTQVAATVTAGGGTQVVATSNFVAITQSAATVTASGGTEVITTVNNVAITQVAGNVIATGGTQTIATSNFVAISQSAANVTARGGTQVITASSGGTTLKKEIYLLNGNPATRIGTTNKRVIVLQNGTFALRIQPNIYLPL